MRCEHGQTVASLTDRLAEAMVDLEERDEELEALRDQLAESAEVDRAAIHASVEVATSSRLQLSRARRELAIATEQLKLTSAELESAREDKQMLLDAVASARDEADSVQEEQTRAYEEWAATNQRRAEEARAQLDEEGARFAALERELCSAKADARALRDQLA
eukprot:CAMPEP_0174244414 /NCGR_PEP_ID=MMETSP0417-20130205/35208_1 /TAXON_ID=242541 /ORGANISM="Mayorella sp, Strain BSH-02190019" /LENGTH=162 /DNA_ID=CAMNT_0015324097 /DNA_START=11 /DNA_END=495 /DNA_ORIENTATION=+